MGAGNSRLGEDDFREGLRQIGLSEEDEAGARLGWKNGGVEGFAKFLQEKEKAWKDMKLNIGVTGISGCGKSTFINTMRELKAKDDGAAKVGVEETTTKPTPYPFPTNPQVVLWDVPGVGSPNFGKKQSYLEDIKFKSYDFFLILSSSRFREDDAWLGKEAAKMEKKFYYVRTKVDEDVINQNYEYPERSEEEVLKSIRSSIEELLKNYDFNHKPLVFLMGRNFIKYDIGNLKEQITEDCPNIKKDQLTLAFRAITKHEIEEKMKVLRKRLWRSTIRLTIHVPILVDKHLQLMEHELQYYHDQLGLSDEGIKRTALISGCNEKVLKEVAEKAYPKELLEATAIGKAVAQIAAFAGTATGTAAFTAAGAAAGGGVLVESGTVAEAALEVVTEAGLVAAALGVAVAGAALTALMAVLGASFMTAVQVLQQSLAKMQEAAELVAEAAMEKSISKEGKTEH